MRLEKDSLGPLQVPEQAYYGVQTARAVVNFPISGQHAHPDFIWATAAIKKAAAIVNSELGLIRQDAARAIIQAAEEIMAGQWRDQFIVDVFQAGAGTSHHMNMNEVIANLAIEILGGQRGQYQLVHPNDHVNFGQSTNDVFPTAMRLAILKMLPPFLAVLDQLAASFQKLAGQYEHVIKSGRTHLQDAVPVTIGQEFGAYGRALEKASAAVEQAAEELKVLGIGGSAAGTGLNTDPHYRLRMVKMLGSITGMRLSASDNLFEAMQSMRPFSAFSGSLRELCLELIRIANDLRLLSSGPATGLDEIVLPAVQPGSSIMPGKVNPVMAEMLNMVCFQVIGHDTTVAMAVQAGQLELNVMMPVIIHNILSSMQILTASLAVFQQRCVDGITVNQERCQYYFANSLGLATVLNAIIGYDQAAQVMKEALREKKPVLQVIEERKILSAAEIKQVFSAEQLTRSGVPGIPGNDATSERKSKRRANVRT
jgi:aspartate ammonia-lyase